MTSDPFITAIEEDLQALRRKNRQLQIENESLRQALAQRRARVTPAVALPAEPRAAPVTQPDVKPVSAWGARDFLAYFQQLHRQYYGSEYHFSRNIYQAALTQLKGMRNRLALENEAIKEIFEFHYENTFNKRFTPSIAYICGTSGMNRYSAGKSTTGTVNAGGYTRRTLEPKEQWQKPVSKRPEAAEALNAKLKGLGRKGNQQ